MNIIQTNLPGVLLLEPKVFGDARGFFLESWNRQTFFERGLDLDFVQDNHSRSARGVLRGLHYQLNEPQGKLVRVVAGAVFDVAVDVRGSSPHFGRWVGYELSAENQRMMWIPPGFAHGFLVLSDCGFSLQDHCQSCAAVGPRRPLGRSADRGGVAARRRAPAFRQGCGSALRRSSCSGSSSGSYRDPVNPGELANP